MKQWVDRGLLKKEEVKSLIEDDLVEVLFDILQRERNEKLTFGQEPNDKLIGCLPSINLKLALVKSNELWKQWCEHDLSELFPNCVGYSVLRSCSKELKKQIQKQADYSYKKLIQSLDGNSLRDVALLLNKPLIQIATNLNQYCLDKKITLHKIEELPLDKPFNHLSPSFYKFNDSQLDAPKIIEDSVKNKNKSSIQTFFQMGSKWTVITLVLTLLTGGGYAFNRFNFLNFLPTPDRIGNQPVRSQIGQGQDITLLGDTFSGYSTFRNPNFQKVLQAEGIRLNYQSQFDQSKRSALLNGGKADLLVTTLDQFLIQQPHGKIVGLIDTTAGADAVVLNNKKYPTLKSRRDLSRIAQQASVRGEKLKIAFAGNTPSEYLALLLSTKFEGLEQSNFEVIRVADAADAWKLMQSQQNIAVTVLWEPFVSQSRKQGYNVVLSSKDVPNSIVDVIVASDRLLASRPKLVSTLIEAYYRRLDASMVSDSQLLDQVADDSKRMFEKSGRQ